MGKYIGHNLGHIGALQWIAKLVIAQSSKLFQSIDTKQNKTKHPHINLISWFLISHLISGLMLRQDTAQQDKGREDKGEVYLSHTQVYCLNSHNIKLLTIS